MMHLEDCDCRACRFALRVERLRQLHANEVKAVHQCPNCDGSGDCSWQVITTCPVCRGAGIVVEAWPVPRRSYDDVDRQCP